MITPVLIDSIGWGTYLFFAVLNAIFFPFIYFFYPETSQRTLEEIDLIFAKGYTEKISYVHAAKLLPSMTQEEIDQKTREYGAVDSDEEAAEGSSDDFGNKDDEKVGSTMREGGLA